MVDLNVVFSFGFICPYLAAAAALSAVCNKQKVDAIIAHVMTISVTDNCVPTAKAALDKTCRGVRNIEMGHIFIIIAVTSCLIIGLFIVDLVADDAHVSFTYAFFFFAATVIVCVGVWYANKLLKHYFPQTPISTYVVKRVSQFGRDTLSVSNLQTMFTRRRGSSAASLSEDSEATPTGFNPMVSSQNKLSASDDQVTPRHPSELEMRFSFGTRFV